MTYPIRYIQYLNLPRIPDEILSELNYNFKEYDILDGATWSNSFNEKIDKWCKDNICDTMYWAFMISQDNLRIHKDYYTKTKINYIITPGGNNVATEWYDKDKTTLLDSVVIEPHRWHIFSADVHHCTKNMEPGKTRFSISGQVFRTIQNEGE